MNEVVSNIAGAPDFQSNQVHYATLIGGNGFIGRHLHAQLSATGWHCRVAEREVPHSDQRSSLLYREELGHVFYCAGLTANFRQHPYETVDAHVGLLSHILKNSRFTSLTYLSSTRIYADALSTAEETGILVRPEEQGDLYNLSKLLGESLCVNSQRPVRIVRLSNVYGRGMSPANFLADVLHSAAYHKHVLFRSAADSQKDYISVADVVRYLPLIALNARQVIYNLASGQNYSHAQIAAYLQSQGVQCEFEKGAATVAFPSIDISRLQAEFGMPLHQLSNDLPQLYSDYCETL